MSISSPGSNFNARSPHFGRVALHTNGEDLRKPLEELFGKHKIHATPDLYYPFHRHIPGEHDQMMIIKTDNAKVDNQVAELLKRTPELMKKIKEIFITHQDANPKSKL
jgi:hypothetical protein